MNAPFVTQLRTRGEAIDLSGGNADAFMIRAQVHEAWDAVRMLVHAGTAVAEVKRAALAALIADDSDAAGYMVKIRGFEVHDESRPLRDMDVRAGTTVFVHSRRRRVLR